MLNTVMALWNQNPAENRQRIVKVLFTTLFIGISIFLLLFSFYGSVWPLFVGAEDHSLRKEKQSEISNHRAIATAVNTPVVAIASIGVTLTITPTAMPTTAPTSTRTSVQPCIQAPVVVAPPPVIIPPAKADITSDQPALPISHSEQKAALHHPNVAATKTIIPKKVTPHARKRPKVRVMRPTVAPATETSMTPSSSTPSPVASVSAQAPTTPVVTVLPTVTPQPIGVVVVNAVVDTGAIDATPTPFATSSGRTFEHSLRRQEALAVPVTLLAKSHFKTHLLYRSDNKECSKSTVSEGRNIVTFLHISQSDALFLSGSLLGVLLLSSCASIFRRQD